MNSWLNFKSKFKFQYLIVSTLLFITLKFPIKMMLINLDLLALYPVICGVYACVLLLVCRLLDAKDALETSKFLVIFTTSICFAAVIYNITLNISPFELYVILAHAFQFTLFSENVHGLSQGPTSSTNNSASTTNFEQGSYPFGWKSFSYDLANRVYNVALARINQAGVGVTPSKQITLADVNITYGSRDWNRLYQFATEYTGNDDQIKGFCRKITHISYELSPGAIVISTLSSQHRSIGFKLIDAIGAKG